MVKAVAASVIVIAVVAASVAAAVTYKHTIILMAFFQGKPGLSGWPLILQTMAFGAKFYAPGATSTVKQQVATRSGIRRIKFGTKTPGLKNQGGNRTTQVCLHLLCIHYDTRRGVTPFCVGSPTPVHK